jgi:hypothetical protein
MMTSLGEAALQSPVVMAIRHVSGAGMNCLFRCLIIILGLIFEEMMVASMVSARNLPTSLRGTLIMKSVGVQLVRHSPLRFNGNSI